jgi:DNA-binding transcriptional ArsR family regulator
MKIENPNVDELFQIWGIQQECIDEARAALPRVVTATELYQGQVVPLGRLVEGLLWDGLTMLIARPKAGKSWLTLQTAVQIAGGRAIDGVTALEHGHVLYCALEEPSARTMARLRKIAPSGDWTNELHFVYDLLPLMGGGAEQLAALIQKLRPRLVILDTFTAIVKTGSKSGSDVFRAQYAEVSRIRRLAEELRTAIIVVHHMRKGVSDSAIEAVAGTGGMGAAIDTLWQLKRKPEGEATLDILGRETEEKTFALRFEQEPFGWRVLGDDAMQLLNAERRQVLDLLLEEGGLTPAQIATELGKARPAVRQLLKRMREDEQVRKQGSKYLPHTP